MAKVFEYFMNRKCDAERERERVDVQSSLSLIRFVGLDVAILNVHAMARNETDVLALCAGKFEMDRRKTTAATD